MNDKNVPGDVNVAGKRTKVNFVLDKGDKKDILKSKTFKKDMKNQLRTQVLRHNKLSQNKRKLASPK
jgi:hypothetical protein